jgi:hypothetical protein
LRFAGAALIGDMNINVHLPDEGVHVGEYGQAVPEGAVNE